MSNQNYITEMLELKDNNVFFYENCYYKEKIKGVTYKIFEGYLSYKPKFCPKCGVLFDDKFEKHGFIISNIKIPKVSGYKTILRLHKQRYLCKHCNKAFTLSTTIANYGCNISNDIKKKIAVDLTKKRSEKDIAEDNDVSPNTVERVMDSYYETQKLYKNYLPEVLLFDEFKSVKTADGSMSFHMCNGITGQTIDIVEDRRLDNLIRYFFYYNYKARSHVRFIVIDMYSPYVSLIKKMFPNAQIVIDKFHLTQLVSRAFNKTRIMIMKKHKQHYKKLKRYWKLLLKYHEDLDNSVWKRFTCFEHLMTTIDIVDYLINIDEELKQTYLIYQEILHSLKTNVNDNIRMYKKCNIKMHNFVHSFCYTFNRIRRYNMKEVNKLKQELLIMKTENIKPNYSELARLHECDRRTIKKYNEGYEGKPVKRNKESRLDKYKEEIKTKLELPGSTIKGTYEYFKNKDDNIGNYSNFYKYSKDFKRNKQNNKFHPRYETEFGKQLQFDWKEDIKMFNKHGEIFKFNIFSSTLGASRLHVFIYSKYKTKIDVQRCLVKTFQYIGGLPEETLTDNMSSIVDTKKKEFYKDFISFSKDIGFIPKKCKPRHAYTKGKDESCNRFMSWLIPYNGEFETEEELIKIIKKINLEVNKQINETIGTSPILLFQKEKEYLKPLPTNKILNSYLYDTITVKVSNESLFYYKGSKYSVPIKFINHTLSLREEDNKLYIYYNKDLITIHNISNQYINYKDEHYNEGIMTILKHKTQNEIEDISRKNLDLINRLSEVQK